MSIHGFMDQNGQIQKYDYNDLENIPDTIGEEIVLVQDVQPIEENNKIWLPLTQSSNTVEVPTMDEFNALAEEVQSGGLSDAAKEALLTLLQHVAYIDEHGQDYYDDLEEALAGGTQYTITNNLTGCTTSNSSTRIVKGSTYTATITASSGYTLEGATATATMGGQTVTGFYNNGTISIPNVTGNLVITVTASSSVTSISAVFTQGSAIIYDNDSLDSLRQYLVVTATYFDSTTATVTDYTLSGTLEVGTSTITVGYGNKTDTFSVAVTQHVTPPLYSWDFRNNNLTDSVSGLVAATTASQIAAGIKFTAQEQYIVLNTATKMSVKNKTIEIDIASMSNASGSHMRLFNVSSESTYKTNVNSDSYLLRSSGGWYSYAGDSWSSSHLDSSTYSGSYFSGKTVVLKFNSAGNLSVSVDGNVLITYNNTFTKTGYLVLGGSWTDYLYKLSPTISGLRIYDGV